MTVTVWPNGFPNLADFTISVRKTCNDIATEIGCSNKIGPNNFNPETLLVPLTKGETYYILVDGTDVVDFSGFQIEFKIPTPEDIFMCDDHVDNDGDGYLDCDDATNCQLIKDCTPGTSPTGEQCFSSKECQSNPMVNDPICLRDQEGFADGYCSQFCDPTQDPIAECAGSGDGVCVDSQVVLGKYISKSGVCLDGCASIADCRPGYECADLGLAKKVCVVGPEATCDDFKDNDSDFLIDCQDPDCQASISCQGGVKATGQPCFLPGECTSNKNDPVCISEPFFGWPKGYCSQFCDLAAMDDCGNDALCSQNWITINGSPLCLKKCVNQNQCLPGYICLDIGNTSSVCVF